MSKSKGFLKLPSDKPHLRNLFVTRFTSNIHRWDGLVNDMFSTDEEFEDCLNTWYVIKDECKKHFSLREVEELIDEALRRVAHETLQGDASNETAD